MTNVYFKFIHIYIALLQDKTQLPELQDAYENQKRTWEAEKDLYKWNMSTRKEHGKQRKIVYKSITSTRKEHGRQRKIAY